MFRFFYGIGIRFYTAAIHLASNFNPKAKLWKDGRKNWRSRYADLADQSASYIWVHCASLGEFEQGRPVIEALKESEPDIKILLTFFSPSGYEIRKDYAQADVVCYLPADSASSARDFLRIFKPKLALFVKYEIWPNYFLEMQKQGIPVLLFSAIFRKEQRFFKPWGSLFRKALRSVDHIFVQDENSMELLRSINIKDASIAGDTRFDRVMKIAAQAQPVAIVEEFKSDARLLIVGSSWPAEERVVKSLLSFLSDGSKVVIAPHETDKTHLTSIEALFGDDAIFYSKAQLGKLDDKKVLVIDNVGMLSRIYRYADVSMIGGGFGKGIHNTLEAAVFGMPVLFGPEYHKFREARDLIDRGAAFSSDSESGLKGKALELLEDQGKREKMGKAASQYVKERSGATEAILNHLKKNHLHFD